MKRSAVSITSNIAEGFGRRGAKEKSQFYSISTASLVELQNQLLIARDVGYLDRSDFTKVSELTVKCHKVINGLKRANKARE
jgi:four helix bundle protein